MSIATIEEIKNTSGRIMGVDFGEVRTGIAISDASRFLASGIGYIKEGGLHKTAEKIAQMVKDENVTAVVIGCPVNMNGTEGPRAELCREFAEQLKEATGLPVVLWDERRTTVEAHNILSMHNYHGQKRKNTVDAVAASLILEGYLQFRGR